MLTAVEEGHRRRVEITWLIGGRPLELILRRHVGHDLRGALNGVSRTISGNDAVSPA
jgi:hypothetical protein